MILHYGCNWENNRMILVFYKTVKRDYCLILPWVFMYILYPCLNQALSHIFCSKFSDCWFCCCWNTVCSSQQHCTLLTLWPATHHPLLEVKIMKPCTEASRQENWLEPLSWSKVINQSSKGLAHNILNMQQHTREAKGMFPLAFNCINPACNYLYFPYCQQMSYTNSNQLWNHSTYKYYVYPKLIYWGV